MGTARSFTYFSNSLFNKFQQNSPPYAPTGATRHDDRLKHNAGIGHNDIPIAE